MGMQVFSLPESTRPTIEPLVQPRDSAGIRNERLEISPGKIREETTMIDTKLAPYAALLLRVSLGVLFLAHGLLKLVVFTPAGTAGFFGSLGLPAALAYLTIFAELVGGTALIAGLYTRWVSLALVPILLGSIVFVHGGKGWLFSGDGGGWEFPAFWAIALIVQALVGDGAYSIHRRQVAASPVLN